MKPKKTLQTGTGSRKTTHLLTLQSLHKGEALIIDPKGQMVKMLTKASGKKRNFCVIDPFRHFDQASLVRVHQLLTRGLPENAHWNLFDEIDTAAKD